jgi:hypothetical protein
MRKARKSRILRRLALGLAVAAFVVPAAQARVDDPGARSSDAVVIHGDDKAISPRSDTLAGDDKVIVPAPGSYSVASYRRALPEDYPTAPVAAVRTPGSFDWGDAMVGVLGAFTLMLLAAGLVLGARQRPTAA